ncbi:metal-sulfur cluster biosynthetic enzyme [Alkalicoccobacillus murimartini]|uniref:Metal-sulfur cluster biosynthetic enzyme n=1 Tax=Alkalicoccobacillus murimartini TaxID=171685 RepID=A0ABT9YD34_9BACI|nr:metal-sulfur cluster biosynthetic enzyme [Alkalicoccobacillus murimartini]
MSQEIEKQQTKDQVMGQLENVIDPELGVDIVNLGLVYEIQLDDKDNVTVVMTLTAMGCPLAGEINQSVKDSLKELQEVGDIGEVAVDIVWNPPWSKSMMSRYAKIALNVHES